MAAPAFGLPVSHHHPASQIPGPEASHGRPAAALTQPAWYGYLAVQGTFAEAGRAPRSGRARTRTPRP